MTKIQVNICTACQVQVANDTWITVSVKVISSIAKELKICTNKFFKVS